MKGLAIGVDFKMHQDDQCMNHPPQPPQPTHAHGIDIMDTSYPSQVSVHRPQRHHPSLCIPQLTRIAFMPSSMDTFLEGVLLSASALAVSIAMARSRSSKDVPVKERGEQRRWRQYKSTQSQGIKRTKTHATHQNALAFPH